MAKGKVDTRALKKWAKDIKSLADTGLDSIYLEAAEMIASEFVKRVMGSSGEPRTPVKTGKLHDGWKVDTITKTAEGYEARIVNSVDYASYVEYGHRKVNKEGKTIGWQDGVFMMTITEQEMETVASKILSEKFEQMLKKVF